MTDKKKFTYTVPPEYKLSSNKDNYYEILKRHEEACENEQAFYTDPESGHSVFTAYYLLKSGACCGSGCRHCPY